MNVFEDLIVELKEANLLERTVIDDQLSDDMSHLEDTVVPDAGTVPLRLSYGEAEAPPADVRETEVELDSYDAHLHETVVPERSAPQPAVHSKARNGQEFYRKRAMSEVSTLQMVEHVLTGVEREYMKIRPRSFDDFEVKKRLNTFLQVTENENSDEHQEAEFKLMTETEAWCTALADRDRDISVQDLRQYCENSRPPLSSQALVALARFYRNLPFSATVRAKFDFVITRLFSRAAEDETRAVIFTREEMLGHIRTLYREWSSIAVYGDDESESKLGLSARSFEDLAVEAEGADSFDRLIDNGFFNRLRSFKDSVGEMFYAPGVLAAAIDSNVRIGNAYVRLIDRERRKMDAAAIRSKCGGQHDEIVSEGIGKTLELVDLLRMPIKEKVELQHDAIEPEPQPAAEAAPPDPAPEAPAAEPEPKPRPVVVEWLLAQFRAANKILLGVATFLILASVGIYVYANYFASSQGTQNSGVRDASISDPLYKDYVTTGRISQDTFYGILLPSWDGLPKEKKQEILAKIVQSGKQDGYVQVNLIGADGKPAGFASPTRLEVYSQ
jgi:hypothetical protein